jgi:hypothetical protein
MTKKAEFNAEEWSKVTEGPLLAGMRVVTAGRGGTVRETLAMSKVYKHARSHHGESELLDELLTSPPSINPDELAAGQDIASVVKQRLQEVVEILGQKATPDELEAYKGFVTSTAQAAAGAHREGGFLGIGGKHVSDGEQTALDEIAAALGAKAQAPEAHDAPSAPDAPSA